jgi:adenylate cyclase
VRRRDFEPVAGWLRARRLITDPERQAVLRMAVGGVYRIAPVWFAAALTFGLVGATESTSAGAYVGLTVLMGGITTCAIWYLLVERLMRPVTALALAGGRLDQPRSPGVAVRVTMAWVAATGVPLLGVCAAVIGELAGVGFHPQRTLSATLALVAIAGVVGLFTLLVAVRAVAERVAILRAALDQIARGDYRARVSVDDASEVGLLQAGFNDMAAGLAERERIREAFGTYVDPGVAAHILDTGIDLSGEDVEVTVMFIDIRDFTRLTAQAGPQETLATLNRLFSRAVPLIHAEDGHVDKFVGDGLLAVFGAPARQQHHADRALSAALAIADAVDDEFGDTLRIGIGLNSGIVTAGSVGGGGRLEFSVIGNAVNIAARIEAATRTTGDTVLIAPETRDLLTESTADLRPRSGITLRGAPGSFTLYAATTARSRAPRRDPGTQ